jgi:multimeric flavodoxin WrbA
MQGGIMSTVLRGEGKKILALLGTYRKGHVIEKIVDEILKSASEQGAKTEKIFLPDKKIEFCMNCRNCTQIEGVKRGKCIHNDDMGSILNIVDDSDGIVIASPVNFSNVTAMTRRFMERLICYTYWPWGGSFPRTRIKRANKKAVLVSASGAPSFFVYLLTGTFKALKIHADIIGARSVGRVCMGFASGKETPDLPVSIVRKAKRFAQRLL